jgi:hypothetical protein
VPVHQRVAVPVHQSQAASALDEFERELAVLESKALRLPEQIRDEWLTLARTERAAFWLIANAHGNFDFDVRITKPPTPDEAVELVKLGGQRKRAA